MGVFDNIEDDTKVEASTDNVGGGGFTPMASGIYKMKVDAAFMGESKSGAYNVTLHLKDEVNQKSLKETIYITKNKVNGQGNTYTKDGKNYLLPGYDLINNLCMVGANMPFKDMSSKLTEKYIKLYDFDAKKELATKVDMLAPLIDQEVYVAVLFQTETKNKKVGNKYVPTAETRDINVIAAVMRARDKMTVPELKAKATEASFYTDWETQWKDKVRMKLDKNAPKADTTSDSEVASADDAEMFAMPE